MRQRTSQGTRIYRKLATPDDETQIPAKAVIVCVGAARHPMTQRPLPIDHGAIGPAVTQQGPHLRLWVDLHTLQRADAAVWLKHERARHRRHQADLVAVVVHDQRQPGL